MMSRCRSAALFLFFFGHVRAIHTGNTGDGDTVLVDGKAEDGISEKPITANIQAAADNLASAASVAADDGQRTVAASFDAYGEDALYLDDAVLADEGDDDSLDIDDSDDEEDVDDIDDSDDEEDADDIDDDYHVDEDQDDDDDDDNDDEEEEYADDDDDSTGEDENEDEDDTVDEDSDDDDVMEKGDQFGKDVPLQNLSGRAAIVAHVKSEKKPGMVLVTSSTCPVCHKLIQSVNADAAVKTEMNKFVAVSAVDSAGNEWKAQGEATYWPRVYFVKEDGSFYPVPPPKSKYPHYFWSAAQLNKAMTQVLSEAK